MPLAGAVGAFEIQEAEAFSALELLSRSIRNARRNALPAGFDELFS